MPFAIQVVRADLAAIREAVDRGRAIFPMEKTPEHGLEEIDPGLRRLSPEDDRLTELVQALVANQRQLAFRAASRRRASISA
jgi:hypothetical protein